MKLKLEDLIPVKEIVQAPPVPSVPVKPFVEEVASNVKQGMDILENIGLKDLFVQKAKDEIMKRFNWGYDGNPKKEVSQSHKSSISQNPNMASIPYDNYIGLATVWLRSFIAKNGDMKLSEFVDTIEENKANLVASIKSVVGDR